MSWANYYQAKIPAGASIQDMLAAARRIVATCARPPIALDARWKPSQVVDLAAFAGRIAAIEPAGERIVDAELMPADPQALLDILGRCGHAVELTVGGSDTAPGLFLTIELERAATAGEFQVTAQLNFEGDRTVESDGVLTAAIERIDRCRARGVLPIAAGGREVVDRFLAAARRDDDERALVRGVDADGYRLMCRSWRGRVPARITIVAARPVALAAAELVALWDGLPLYVRARLSGPGCVATAAALGRLAGAYTEQEMGPYLEVEVEVRGEPELGALVEVSGEDPVVAQWWCGFDAWGAAYHGVRLALHGRYQDGNVGPEPGHHEVIVMVDGKRRDPGAHEVAEGLAARCGFALEFVRTGL